MTRVAAVYLAFAAFGFIGCQIAEPWLSPALEHAAKAWVARETGDRK